MHAVADRERRTAQAAPLARARRRGATGSADALTPAAAALADLQRGADTAPAVQRLAATEAALQRRAAPGAGVAQLMRIGRRRIPPTGKRGKELLAKVRLALLTAGLSPWGTTKKFRELADENVDYVSDEAFVTHFLELAHAEVERVDEQRRQGNKAKGWTRRLKLGRPGWPKTYKSVVKRGEDIRHIVRNATLKNALEAERNYQLERGGEPAALEAMNGIAAALGLGGDSVHSFEALAAIYRTAYLNLGNLFAGAGAVNRVIGLTADEITGIGLALANSTEWATPERITEIFERVAWVVSEATDDMENQAESMQTEQATVFLSGLEEFFDNITDFLIDREDQLVRAASIDPEEAQQELDESTVETWMNLGVPEAQLGLEFVDMGANFGFDIPDDALESLQMQELIKTEIALASYVPGDPGYLAQVLQHFMNVKHVLQV